MSLRIVAVSDLHGFLPEIIEPADIMLIAGDISPLTIQFNKPEVREWFENEFAEWVESLPVDKVYMVAGNHDAYFEGINPINLKYFKDACKSKLIYLENNYVIHNHNGIDYKIFGTPYCHMFGNWPFMKSDEYMFDKFKDIPEDCDIIISHDPPYAVGQVDMILGKRRWSNEIPASVGNIPLSNRLVDVNFKLLVCGHIHTGDHKLFKGDLSGQVVNVSIKDENYDPVYEPFYIEID
jgi:Icc-related predicted phosphoesterase